MTATSTAAVVDNRTATKDDAETLKRIYTRLAKLVKEHKAAVRACQSGWVDRDDMTGLRAKRDATQFTLDKAMDESWTVLTSLPKGTVASGGATIQTVALELFNRNLNRNLKTRITASDARKINKASFA